MHIFIVCLLLGIGAAAPVGPINIEIIRRNIHLGLVQGIIFGAGACLADLTYLILLTLGILSFLQYPTLLDIVGIVGSLIIAWFGISIFRSNNRFTDAKVKDKMLVLHLGDGYVLTLFNPYTILFWASVSAQIANIGGSHGALIYGGAGVLVGTFGWVLFLNILMHYSKRLMSEKITKWINIIGGCLLIAIAILGLVHAILDLV